jgi:glycogen(starch) synthase
VHGSSWSAGIEVNPAKPCTIAGPRSSIPPPVRIALVPSSYAPAVGGVERVTAQLARHLIAAGDGVEVWTTRHPAELPPMDEVDGVLVRRLPFFLPSARLGPLASFPIRSAQAFAQLRAAAESFKPDLIHTHCFGVNGVYSLSLAALRRLPLVVTLHGETVMDDHDIYERSQALRFALRLALRRADGVTACSQYVMNDAIRRFGRPRRLQRVIFNGIDDEEREMPVAYQTPTRRFVFSLGRLVHKKGFDLLLDAFCRLPPSCDDVELVVGGTGPEREALEQKAQQLGIENRVTFAGLLNRSEVACVMERAAAFVLPSRVEPFGLVILEAMRAGRPVLFSKFGGASEILTSPAQGIAIDPFDTERFAMSLGTVLADGELASRLGREAHHRLADFSWADVASQYQAVYTSVVSRRNQEL